MVYTVNAIIEERLFGWRNIDAIWEILGYCEFFAEIPQKKEFK